MTVFVISVMLVFPHRVLIKRWLKGWLKGFWVLLYKKTVVSESITFCRVMMISESLPKLNVTVVAWRPVSPVVRTLSHYLVLRK